jgi:hypothetical protein
MMGCGESEIINCNIATADRADTPAIIRNMNDVHEQ